MWDLDKKTELCISERGRAGKLGVRPWSVNQNLHGFCFFSAIPETLMWISLRFVSFLMKGGLGFLLSKRTNRCQKQCKTTLAHLG